MQRVITTIGGVLGGVWVKSLGFVFSGNHTDPPYRGGTSYPAGLQRRSPRWKKH
ncbi:hypothetical protein Micbo1qcDRAFT_3190 [Microdochium bolleyi]|uniref:Uncharacterized protein n=1 Tax=Microdochium bolleyi TaxID=196109 RepID=A0A136JI63_9PEZI|nr:hypothetical protein Micbo1qcDRAFT_3190 [Microdochium bolleyi]